MRHDIFTTPLWSIEGAPQQLIDELYQGAYKLKEYYSDNLNRSNQGGYHSTPLIWEDFHPQGIEYIDKVVGDIFKFKVIEWWYNINGKGHWNIPHTHPSSDIALVLYLTDSDGLLQLMNPFPQRNVESDNVGNVGINAKKGDIIMFPSDIIHYVKPNPREEDRISISMNLQLC
tara:strand:- start:115 stop:633 length:519 start_codon:yes stop_codon:yes gene_type:complete